MNQTDSLRNISLAIAAVILTTCVALAFDEPAKKKDTTAGKTAKPPPLVVWSGDAAPGQTWAKMGPQGSLTVADKAGVGKSGKGLELRCDGDGWRGCGVNWKGWFPEDACDDAARFSSLVFQIRQVSKSPRATLSVMLVDNVKRTDGAVASAWVDVLTSGGVDKIDGTWRRVVIPLENFARGKPLQLSRLWEIDFANDGGGDLVFQIDQIGFSDAKAASPKFAPGESYQARVSIAADKELHAISENIYGLCGWPREKQVQYGIKITRWGGNPSTRYNWKLNVDNGANDWFFKNRGQLTSQLDDTGYLRNILGNQSFGATTYQTVPMIGWVAKDAGSYGFSVGKYGAQKGTEPGYPDVGNGLRADDKPVTGNDPRETSVPAPPEFIEEAVRFVVSR
ncbi:MAG TPA: glycoside hydrolase family 44 protein, partial [Planctomycetaceae bacterium]